MGKFLLSIAIPNRAKMVTEGGKKEGYFISVDTENS